MQDLAGPSVAVTYPPMSASRAAGIAWYCAQIAKSAPASGDAARFMAGL